MSDRPRIGPQLALKQTQRLALNATLGASIQLLRSDAAGLTRYLEEQAASNPHLRLDPPPAPGLHEWLPRWQGVLHGGDASNLIDQAPDAAPGLMAHVGAAITQLRLTGPESLIADALVNALEPSGWLGQSGASIAAEIGVPVVAVNAVIAKVQTIDPPGLFARSLSECLSLQAAEAGILDEPLRIILQNLDLLANGDVARLAQLCRVSQADVMGRFRLIRSLNPKPGAEFAPMAAGHVREPDLIVRQSAQLGWSVSLNRSSLPDLHVNPDAPSGSADQLAAARALHRMVNARSATLLRVAAEIVLRQSGAIDFGPAALAPLTMAEIAQAVGMHKSTISRVVNGASIDTPKGSWALRKFFSPAMGGDGAQILSAAALRHHLARLISLENPASPITDAALAVDLTAATGVPIAHRTVTKYRMDQGIPTASRRKRKYSNAASLARATQLQPQPQPQPPTRNAHAPRDAD